MLPMQLTDGTIGKIGTRQTTYLELHIPSTAEDPAVRVSFRGKKEFLWGDLDFVGVSLKDDHPLLLDYKRPWKNLFLAGKSPDSEQLVLKLRDAIKDLTINWRDPDLYLNNPIELLQQGHGMLVRGPDSIIMRCSEILAQDKIEFTILDSHTPKEEPIAVLFLGNSYLIANAFEFKKLGI